jgi:hypothetical protein
MLRRVELSVVAGLLIGCGQGEMNNGAKEYVAASTVALTAGAAGSPSGSPSGNPGNPSSAASTPTASPQKEITIASLPFSACTLTSTLMQTSLHVWADDLGIVHLWAEPSATSHVHTLDCDESGATVRHSFDLAGPKTFVPAVARVAAVAHKVLPPLTDPMSKSQSELIQEGYGLRPDPSSPLFAKWAEVVSKPLTVVAPRSVPNPWASNEPATFTTSRIWDGIALNKRNTRYWAAIGAFTIPTFTAQANQGNTYHNGLWPGVGGDTIDTGERQLIQDGIDFQSNGVVNTYYLWTQYVPDETFAHVIPGFVPRAGDSMLVEAWEGDADCNFYGIFGGSGYACFQIFDYTQSGTAVYYPFQPGQNDNPHIQGDSNTFGGFTCEGIMERQSDGRYLASWTSASMEFGCYDAIGGFHEAFSDPFFLKWMSRDGAQSNYLAGSAKTGDDTESFYWYQRN